MKIPELAKMQMLRGTLINYSVGHGKPVLGVMAKVHVMANVSPKFVTARSVPFFLQGNG